MKLRRKKVWETWRGYFQYVTHELVIAYEPLEREVDRLRAEVAGLSGYVSQLQTHMSHQLEHRHHTDVHSERGGTLGPIYPKKEPETSERCYAEELGQSPNEMLCLLCALPGCPDAPKKEAV